MYSKHRIGELFVQHSTIQKSGSCASQRTDKGSGCYWRGRVLGGAALEVASLGEVSFS